MATLCIVFNVLVPKLTEAREHKPEHGKAQFFFWVGDGVVPVPIYSKKPEDAHACRGGRDPLATFPLLL